MKTCDACLKPRDELYFRIVSGGQRYYKLSFVNVCILCQVKYKTCSRCHGTFPGTTARYIYRKESGLYGLHSICISCMTKRRKRVR